MVDNKIINRLKSTDENGLLNGIDATFELAEVVTYMTKILINEFPTNIITSEYLMLSILDTKTTHANLILDSCLMSSNLEELRKVYVSVLEGHVKPQGAIGGYIFDTNLIRLLQNAKEESKKMKNEKTGTEHVLLAAVNESNSFAEKDIFKKFSITYDFLFSKCEGTKDEIKKPKKPKVMPLKSQINTKTVSNGNTEYISKYTININDMVRDGKIDDIVGRDREIKEIIKVLSRRKKNNVILVGHGGVGKTAIVHCLAKHIVNREVPSVMEDKEIVCLNIMAIVSGTNLRGMFEERVNGLFKELQASDKYILFIDDIHTVLKSGSKEKDTDISGMIGDILSGGNIKIIASTTFKEYRNTVEINSSISRMLQKIVIEPSTKEESYEILQKNKKYYESFHNVEYTDEAIKKSIDLAERYITDRRLPDSAIDIMDMAGANTVLIDQDTDVIKDAKRKIREINEAKESFLNKGEFEMIDALNEEENYLKTLITDKKREQKREGAGPITITDTDILEVVADMTHIPISKLSSNDKEKLANIDKVLKQSIVGQDDAIDTVCKVIKRNKVGLGNGSKPLGTLLLLGPSGVGKTLVAKKLAEEVFGDENALIRIDMSEYSEKSSISKLIGSAPGYIGYENGGQLTEAVKHKQYCVLLLDEIEKADQEVYNLFLQLFDEGRLTDSGGQTISFKNVIVLMTSNVGARRVADSGEGLGFVKNEELNKKNIINSELKKRFTPEFLNRIDKIVYFNSLSNNNLKDIVKLELNKFNTRLNKINYNIFYDDDVVTYLQTKAVDAKEYGARPIIRLVQENIEDQVTELMLTKEYPMDYTFSASCIDNAITIQ